MVGGGFMQLLAYGTQDVYIYNNYKNKTTFNYNKSDKSHKYSGKNNFYKQHNNKIEKEIINKENKEKINIKNNNIEKIKKTIKKIKQPVCKNIFTNVNTYINNSSTNNYIRCLSMKLFIKMNIIQLLIKNIPELDYNLIPEFFVKLYRIYLFIIIKVFYNNSKVNISEILSNNIDSIYLLKFKNIIVENFSINKLVNIIETPIKIFIEKKIGIKIKQIINSDSNNTKLIKSNKNCPVTLEEVGNIYFHCRVCNTKYSFDGLMYWYQINNKCTTPWCLNYINKFNFCYEINNINNLNNAKITIIDTINYYYNLVLSENLISI